MANRYFADEFSRSLERGKVALFGRITFGAAGAPTLDTANSKGIASVVRNSAGKYTITLQDTYARFLALDPMFLVGSGLPAAPLLAMVSQAVSTAGAPTIILQCANISGAATDPASGEELDLMIMLKNSSV